MDLKLRKVISPLKYFEKRWLPFPELHTFFLKTFYGASKSLQNNFQNQKCRDGGVRESYEFNACLEYCNILD